VNPVPAIAVCAVMLIAIIAGLTWVSMRLHAEPPYQPGHTHRAVRERLRTEAATPSPAGHEPDPDLAGDTCDTDEADWWDQQPPPPRAEILTGPAARIAQTSALTVNVLTRVRDALRNLDDDGGEADDTRHDLHAVATWGKTAPELADELAARYLT